MKRSRAAAACASTPGEPFFAQEDHNRCGYGRGGVGDEWYGFKTVAGYGAGLRWRTPVGPVNLDVAYGEAVHRFRFHFSIGYTF